MLEDLSAFLLDFGVSVVYGTQTAIAIFDTPDDSNLLNGRMVTAAYSIRFRATDLVGLKHKDQVVINGGTYVVNDVERDVDGSFLKAHLQKP